MDESYGMTRRAAAAGVSAAAASALAPAAWSASARMLPRPAQGGGMPLMAALKARRSQRGFRRDPLPAQVLSDLLWAAFGVNRAGGGRTAPSWHGVMAIELYLAMADGVWRFDPMAHALLPHLAADLRARTGTQDFAGIAPLDLVYVAHGERMGGVREADRRVYAAADSGFIGQNVYLFCASAGLATVFRASLDHRALEAALKLGRGQFVTFAQTVGRPG